MAKLKTLAVLVVVSAVSISAYSHHERSSVRATAGQRSQPLIVDILKEFQRQQGRAEAIKDQVNSLGEQLETIEILLVRENGQVWLDRQVQQIEAWTDDLIKAPEEIQQVVSALESEVDQGNAAHMGIERFRMLCAQNLARIERAYARLQALIGSEYLDIGDDSVAMPVFRKEISAGLLAEILRRDLRWNLLATAEVVSKGLALGAFLVFCLISTVVFCVRVSDDPRSNLLRIASWLPFSSKTYSTVLEPTIEDIVSEHESASAKNQIWMARWVAARGYYSFGSAVVFQSAISLLGFMARAIR